MRTTIAIDDDAFIAARHVANRERISLGAAVSELIRRGLANPPPEQAAAPRGKYTVYPRRGEVITSEHVYRLMEQEGI